MFFADKPFSVVEAFVSIMPPEAATMGGTVIRQMFNAKTFSFFFPELVNFG